MKAIRNAWQYLIMRMCRLCVHIVAFLTKFSLFQILIRIYLARSSEVTNRSVHQFAVHIITININHIQSNRTQVYFLHCFVNTNHWVMFDYIWFIYIYVYIFIILYNTTRCLTWKSHNYVHNTLSAHVIWWYNYLCRSLPWLQPRSFPRLSLLVLCKIHEHLRIPSIRVEIWTP